MKHELSIRGIVINRFPFSNTSLIVSWMTAEVGLLKTMAKGANRPKSPFSGHLDLYYLCEVHCTVSESSDLATLREVRLLHPFLALRRDWKVILCVQYFAELLQGMTEPHAEIIEFFEVFEKALVYLETNLPTPLLVARYEKKLLSLSGLPVDVPQALARGLATHHHPVPESRAKLLAIL